MQLFNEITASKAKMVEYTAEIKTLKEKLAAVHISQQAPTSVVSPSLSPILHARARLSLLWSLC